MTTPIDSQQEKRILDNRRFHMAYTLGTEQPVVCSIISAQPLFYFDHEEIDEDEEALFEDFFGSTDDEARLCETAEKTTLSYMTNTLSDANAVSSEMLSSKLEDLVGTFGEELRASTKQADAKDTKETITIEELTALLKQSRLADEYMRFAENYGTTLIYDEQVEDASYDVVSDQIHINPHSNIDEKILLVSRELRRVWQHRQGVLINPLTFHPDQAVVINRTQIADVSVAMIRIAWELQLAGEKGAWERIEKSPMEDLARAFARESSMDFRSLNNGMAASAVFETWFLSDRCRYEDKALIQKMLSDYRGYVFENTDASRTITADMMVGLGSMPFGKNYLAPYISTIMNDPLFTEVRDRSNANFLWFIKFERSFRETECELQQESQQHHLGDRLDDLSNKNKEWFGDNEKQSHVITLPSAADDINAGSDRNAQGRGNIIAFQNTDS